MKAHVGFALALSLFAISPNLHSASSEAKPYLMAVLGDSIPAGFLANTHLLGGQVPIPEKGNWGWPSTPKDLLENKRTLSWASGTKQLSHFVFLTHYLSRTEPGAKLEVANFAKFGAQTRDVIGQASQLAEMMATGKYKSLKYLVLMVGVNDMCALEPQGGIPDDQVASNLSTIYSKIAQTRQDEPVRILFVGMGRVADLGKDFIRKNKTYGGMTCGKWYDTVVDLCRQFTTWKTPEEYQSLLKHIAKRNQNLKDAAGEAMKRHANLSIHFSSQHYDAPVFPQALAHDCFHPNREAQAVLSTKTWAEQPFFK